MQHLIDVLVAIGFISLGLATILWITEEAKRQVWVAEWREKMGGKADG